MHFAFATLQRTQHTKITMKAAPQLPLLSIVKFGEMVSPQRKTLSQLKKNSNIPLPFQCKALQEDVPDQSQIVPRRSAKYQPSIWDYNYIQSLTSDYMDESYTKQRKMLKEEVKMTLCGEINHVDQLEIIDVLQRLGVAYHFNYEIRNMLENVYNNMDVLMRKNNLSVTALTFRLLRQHGYNISTDVFLSFQDKTGKFKECLHVDVKGLLSLYEASFHSKEGELILDEARDFTSKFLKEFVNKNRGNDTLLILINHALEFPLHWRMPRLEARWFIDFVGKRRQSVSDTLLQFAKLDFNTVQRMHLEELKCTSRWWKRIELVEELDFARDRLVENFCWGMVMNFKPELQIFREVITKVNSFITTIDDIYDVYGTLEELHLFTKVVESWDLNNAMDTLPHYMKICFLALYNFVNDIAFFTLKASKYNIIPYLKKAWVDLCKSYLVEAKWYHSGYTPSLQEYMENAWISIGAPVILTHAYILVQNPLKREDLDCIKEYPDIIRFSSIILRLADDIGSYKREMKTGDVSKSIQCYIDETGASEEDSRKYLSCVIRTTWMKMNEAAQNSSFSDNFIEIAVNIARISLSVYQYGDGFTIQDHETRSRIISLIMQPIPITFQEKI